MHWLNTLDATLFHWVNPGMNNRVFDAVMPFLSGNPFFLPLVLLACAMLLWKGGARGRLCVLMLAVAIGLGDGLICNTLKHLIGRPRPFLAFTDVHVPASIGMTGSGSMPSSHATNWFAATMVLFVYYRRSIRFMLPLAVLVAFSRVYNGVHYPSDVLAGAILGAGTGAAAIWALDSLWRWAGRRWFPLWWQELPSLANPALTIAPVSKAGDDAAWRDQHWLRLGYVIIFLELAANLIYLASGSIGLSGDEAYQWVWSKHLALSYYSKPLLIAVTQFLGTFLWGDNAFGVRFFSPIISAITSLALLRFLAPAASVRAAFWLTAILSTVPLMAAGSVLMTIDPLSVMFWTLAMLAGWRAIDENSTTRDWLWVGLWMGLGFLSKYTGLFQLLSWAAVFVFWTPARKQLHRPGPYLAFLVNLLCTLPVIIWNSQRDWITFHHVATGGHLDQPWALTPANLWIGFSHTLEFLGGEAALLNPFYFLPVIWAACAFWPRRRDHPLLVYFFCMGAPVFLFYLVFTLRSRVNLNWIAPSVVPFFCLAVVYWEERWREGFRPVKLWLKSGLIIGTIAVVVMHVGDLLPRIIGQPLPPVLDVWRRVDGWPETAEQVGEARRKLEAEGKKVFIIGAHYQITGELSFYLPEASAAIQTEPIVYYLHSDKPDNQFYFWPGYEDRKDLKGQNALYVVEMDFLEGAPYPPPPELLAEFDSVKDLGEFKVTNRGRVVRRLQIMECRNLR